LCLGDWAVRLGVPRGRIDGRLRLGWSVSDALTAPVRVERVMNEVAQ
jgi:hypothetical protein